MPEALAGSWTSAVETISHVVFDEALDNAGIIHVLSHVFLLLDDVMPCQWLLVMYLLSAKLDNFSDLAACNIEKLECLSSIFAK